MAESVESLPATTNSIEQREQEQVLSTMLFCIRQVDESYRVAKKEYEDVLSDVASELEKLEGKDLILSGLAPMSAVLNGNNRYWVERSDQSFGPELFTVGNTDPEGESVFLSRVGQDRRAGYLANIVSLVVYIGQNAE